MTEEVKRLFRSREDRMVAGVCGGLAEYTNLDSTVVRLLFVAVAILGAAPGLVLAYLAMMIIVPEETMIEVSSESD
ncbi:MAG: PspC domain-containing protein [Anaerolineales bacterium]|nr:MAG: PspC domain-containing protein [Anaerolineales bacterium]